jgi:hypothetical protein
MVVTPPPVAGTEATHPQMRPSSGASTSTSLSLPQSTCHPTDGNQFTTQVEHQRRHMHSTQAEHHDGDGAHPNGESVAMVDLRAELDRCCSGEDTCITIEHHRERHRNLEGDNGPPAIAPAGHVTHSPSSLGDVGGCMALASRLCMVV